MRYKLVAIDLDGTLLTDDKNITKENIEILEMLNNKSVEIIIATGRRYWSAKNFVDKLNFNLVIMANNGNIVRRVSDDEVLVSKYLNKNDFDILIKMGKKRGLHPIVHVNHYDEGYDILVEFSSNKGSHSEYLHKNLERYKEINDILNYKASKALVVCYFDLYERLLDFQHKLHNEYPDKYNSHIMNNSTTVGPILEIMNPLGSKWNSIKEYARDRNIKIEEIIAIGDDNNDITMVKGAGLGIAMKNSCREVKEVADIVTDKCNNESGVAYELKKIFNI